MKKILSILALSLTMAQGAWAQTPLTPNADKTEWTLASMPDYDIVLQAEYYTDLLQNIDNNTWITENDGKTASIWLGRTLQKGGWNTFAVPFAIANPASVFGAGVKVKELTDASVSDNTLTLTFGDASSIEAGKPYLLKVGANVVNPTFDNVTISKNTIPTEFADVVSFVPVINPTALTKNDKTKLFVTGGNKLTYPNTDGNINGFRAYFQLPFEMAARQFVLNFGEGDPTVVGEVESSMVNGQCSMDNESWYDLSGRKYDSKPTKPGVYVHKGEKQVIE